MIEGQCHFLTMAQGRVHSKIKTGFSQKLLCCSESFFMKAFRYKEMKHLMTQCWSRDQDGRHVHIW